MNSYDGNYSSVYVNDEEYIVMRLNWYLIFCMVASSFLCF
jgi:hypothetical protein